MQHFYNLAIKFSFQDLYFYMFCIIKLDRDDSILRTLYALLS